MSDAQRLLTDSEAGAILRLTPTQTLRLAKAGEIPSVSLPNGEVRFVPSDLWEWVESRKQPATAGGNA